MKPLLFILFLLYITHLPLPGQWDAVRINELDTFSYLKYFSFYDITFFNFNSGCVIGGEFGTHWGNGKMLSTYDGGNTWEVGAQFIGEGFCPYKYELFNRREGFLLGADFGIGDRTRLFRTYDSGNLFERLANVGEEICANMDICEGVQDMFILNNSRGYLLVNHSIQEDDIHYDKQSILETTDQGETWEQIYSFDYFGLRVIYFIDKDNGWVVGDPDKIIHLSGSGNWSEQSAPANLLPLNKVYFCNRNCGWIAGGYNCDDGFECILLKTNDGGGNWEAIQGMNYLVHDLLFFNPDTGWIAGEDKYGRGVLHETKDGGANWDILKGDLSGPLRTIEFKDGVGWAGGHNGLLLKNENSGYIINPLGEKSESIEEISLDCFPNPFREKTVISYRLPVIGKVEINIYDFIGSKVTTLLNESQSAGSHKVQWNGEGYKPGIYFCELRIAQSRLVQKMMLLE